MISTHLETSDTWFVEEMHLLQSQHPTRDLLAPTPSVKHAFPSCIWVSLPGCWNSALSQAAPVEKEAEILQIL